MAYKGEEKLKYNMLLLMQTGSLMLYSTHIS